MTSSQFCVFCMILSWAMAFPGLDPELIDSYEDLGVRIGQEILSRQ